MASVTAYSLRLSNDLRERLQAEAKRLHTPLSWVIIQAARWYLNSEKDWDGAPLGTGMRRLQCGDSYLLLDACAPDRLRAFADLLRAEADVREEAEKTASSEKGSA